MRAPSSSFRFLLITVVALEVFTSRSPGDSAKVDVDCSYCDGLFHLVCPDVVFRLVKVDVEFSCYNGTPHVV